MSITYLCMRYFVEVYNNDRYREYYNLTIFGQGYHLLNNNYCTDLLCTPMSLAKLFDPELLTYSLDSVPLLTAQGAGDNYVKKIAQIISSFFSLLYTTMEETENSGLLHGHVTSNSQIDSGNPELSCSNERKCKVYKRRWYILFVFTLTSIVSNMMWNTWGPIQRPCRLVFGWEKWTVLLLSSLGAIGPIMGAFPSTWLMDRKGILLITLYIGLRGLKVLSPVSFTIFTPTARGVIIFL